ncbi:hypothetical protein D3C85_1167830 [compost metagenome]
MLFNRLLLTGQTVRRYAPQAAMFLADINRSHGAAQVLRAELQNVASQQVERQLPQHLFSQFSLAIAQPGLTFQPLGAGLLLGKIGAVLLRQVDQIATADICQQAADSNDEQQVKGDAPDRGAAHFLVARGTQLLLHVDHVFELLAHLVGQALAFPGPDRAAIIAAGALQVDHGLRVSGPLLLQGL